MARFLLYEKRANGVKNHAFSIFSPKKVMRVTFYIITCNTFLNIYLNFFKICVSKQRTKTNINNEF